MKNYPRIITAFILVALMALLCPMQAFAASVSAEYISEVKIAYGKTLDDAKKWLTDQGYEVVDADLNEKADSVLSSAMAVCLGYKTTKNADEAITDLKVMNMKGNYSFEAYEMILKEQAEQIGIFVSQLAASLSEYRVNYSKGLYKAIAAHDLLDKIKDDDTGKTMGELLLNKTVQEMGDDAYNALPDAEKANHADMVKILMQGNSQVTLNIEQYLCIASDTADNSFVDRLADIGSYDDFETNYAKEHNIIDGDALEKALAAEYDDTAILLADGIEAFKGFLAEYTDSEMAEETDENTVTVYYDKNFKDGDYLRFCNARNLYLSLSSVNYENGTLYDFFTDEDYDLDNEDRYMLYPLVASLSDGQRACAQYITLSQLFDNGIMDNEGWKTNYDRIKTDIIDVSPVVSVYSGINRELFEGGVALTNAAKQLNDSSTDSFADNYILDSITAPTYLFLAGFAVTAIATIACRATANVLKTQLKDIVAQNFKKAIDIPNGVFGGNYFNRLNSADVTRVTEEMLDGTFSGRAYLTDSFSISNSLKITKQVRLLNCIGNVLCIIMIVISVLTIASTWRDLYNYYHTDKTPIPKYMVDETTDESGNNTYTYYSAVTCNRVEGNFVNDKNKILENYGDLNGDVGKEWLALYCTKDESAGNPIKPEFLCQKGSNTAGNKTPLTMFGDKNALNLVDEKYAYNDSFKGIYLFYSVGSPAVTSSVISTGTIAIIVAAAAAVIAVIAALAIRKKKAKKA